MHPRPKPNGLDVATQAVVCVGEPVGIRTRDLLIKSQLLYRLSYRPTAALPTESGGEGQPRLAANIVGRAWRGKLKGTQDLNIGDLGVMKVGWAGRIDQTDLEVPAGKNRCRGL